MQPESSSKHPGAHAKSLMCQLSDCRFNTELTTGCLCWHTRLWTRLYHGTSDSASTPRQRTNTALDGYATAHPAVRSHRLRETLFSTGCVVCLKLISCICHRKRDSLYVFKSRLKHSYFVGPLTSTHNRLLLALLKLRPYGALQICILLLLMYKTAVYSLFNGGITHQNSKYLKKVMTQQYIA